MRLGIDMLADWRVRMVVVKDNDNCDASRIFMCTHPHTHTHNHTYIYIYIHRDVPIRRSWIVHMSFSDMDNDKDKDNEHD